MALIKRKRRVTHNLVVGRPDVAPDTPAHTPGVSQGNAPGNYLKQPGHHADGTSTAERSTGVDPDSKNPIHPLMPNLSPP